MMVYIKWINKAEGAINRTAEATWPTNNTEAAFANRKKAGRSVGYLVSLTHVETQN